MLRGDLMSRQLCIMMSKDSQRFCYLSKIPDELSVVTGKSEKCSYLFSIVRGFHKLNSWVFLKVAVLCQ